MFKVAVAAAVKVDECEIYYMNLGYLGGCAGTAQVDALSTGGKRSVLGNSSKMI